VADDRVLVGEDRIRTRVAELAQQISADYAGVDELVLVGVLKGAFIFLADLSRQLTIPRRIEFVAVSSYGTEGAAGEVRLELDLRHPIRGRHVLVVDDILDTGRTLDYLVRLLEAQEPASLRTCVLCRKPSRVEVPRAVDYLGFDIPDAWVVGYGLDFHERDRTLPYITTIDGPDDDRS
jgi:hypoxanthine phosphoribosyltransferase